MATDDSDDLEALFDSIASSVPIASPEPVAQPQTAAAPASASGSDASQLGTLAKTLHEAVTAVGLEQLKQAESIVGKVRASIDTAKTASSSLESGASQLATRWQNLMDGKLSVDDFKVLAAETRTFLQDVPAKAQSLSSQLTEASTLSDSLPVKKLGDLANQADQVKSALGALGL